MADPHCGLCEYSGLRDCDICLMAIRHEYILTTSNGVEVCSGCRPGGVHNSCPECSGPLLTETAVEVIGYQSRLCYECDGREVLRGLRRQEHAWHAANKQRNAEAKYERMKKRGAKKNV